MCKDQYNTQPGITYPTQEMTHPGSHFPIFLLQVNNALNWHLLFPCIFIPVSPTSMYCRVACYFM